MTSDLLIAGGGPAGSLLAVLAGRAGLSVRIFESARFPRDKACGEGLMPSGVGVLERAGLAGGVGGAPFVGIRYHGFDIVAEADFPAPARSIADGAPATHGLGQRRLVLDQVLWTAAGATANVQVHDSALVEGVVCRGGRAVGLRVAGEEVAGRLIVGADGARSRVRRALGLDASPPNRHRWGVRRHFRLAPDRSVPDRVEVFVGVGHELYLTPLPGGEILVAALCERGAIAEPTGGTGSVPTAGVEGLDCRTSLPALIALHPALADRLRGATPVSAPRGRSPLACRARAGIAPGAVLLGDAAGFSDPITGGGMAQALLSAELLATFLPRALADSADEWLWRFDRRRKSLLRDYLWLTRLTLEISRSAGAARTMLRLMRGHPRVMRHLVGVAAGLRRLTL